MARQHRPFHRRKRFDRPPGTSGDRLPELDAHGLPLGARVKHGDPWRCRSSTPANTTRFSRIAPIAMRRQNQESTFALSKAMNRAGLVMAASINEDRLMA